MVRNLIKILIIKVKLKFYKYIDIISFLLKFNLVNEF